MSEYPNVLKESLEKDQQFNIDIQNAVNKLFKQQKNSVFKNTEFDAKIINDGETKRYLMVNDSKSKVMAVYSEDISEWNQDEPFKYSLQSLQESGSIYSFRILSFKTKNDKAEKEDNPIARMAKNLSSEDLDRLGMSMEEAIEFLSSARSMGRYREGHYFMTSSAYDLNNFCKFLGVERDTNFWKKHSEKLNEILQGRVSDFFISLKYMQKVADKNNFDADNAFEFNDLDNHMWKASNGIVVDDQNLGFYCVINDQDMTIYAWDQGNNNIKKHTDLDSLLADIENENTNLIDHVALKVENGKVIFVDNAMIYNLDSDIKFTKNALEEEGYGQPEYPVDLYSFNYQLAYYQQNYGYDEFKFMDQALLTLGSGFQYDKENGRFYDSDIEYDANITQYKVQPKTKKVESIYGEPQNFTNLDNDWSAAIARMIHILKTDRPLPIIANTDKEKNDKLDEIIQLYEKGLEKLNKKATKKM